MSGTPSGYQNWSDWLDDFARGVDRDPAHLAAMADMGGSQALPRLARHCSEALEARLRRWNHDLQRDLRAAQTGPPQHALVAVEQALVRSRRALVPLIELASSPLLTAELRQALTSALQEAVEGYQSQAEAEVRRGGRASEDLLRVILRTPMTAAWGMVADRSAPPAPAISAPGRRVLIQPSTNS